MEGDLRAICDLMGENYLVVKKTEKFSRGLTSYYGALLYTAQGLLAQEEMVAANRQLLGSCAQFADMKGATSIAVSAAAARSDDPVAFVAAAAQAHDALLAGREFHSRYIVNVACAMAARLEPGEFEGVVKRGNALLHAMHNGYPQLAGAEDMGLAVLAVMTGRDTEEMLEMAGRCHKMIQTMGYARYKSTLQSTALILGLGAGPAGERYERYCGIRDAMKGGGLKLGPENLPFAAAYTVYGVPAEQAAADVDEADDILLGKKGFRGIAGLNHRLGHLFSEAMVLLAYEQRREAAAGAQVAGGAARETAGAEPRAYVREAADAQGVAGIEPGAGVEQGAGVELGVGAQKAAGVRETCSREPFDIMLLLLMSTIVAASNNAN